MAFLEFPNIRIAGFSACVPKNIESNFNCELINENERSNFIEQTGIEERRIAPQGITSADLCYESAKELLINVKWGGQSVDALIFVSQTPDYILPATACILQEKLGLSKDCLALDISLGCSGWVYGMSVICGLLSRGGIKKALLLCGDTISRTQSYKDKTSYPLFGDAGTCTALEYCEGTKGCFFHLSTDGSGKDAIIIPDGAYRNQTTEKSLEFEDFGEGKVMTRLHARLDGMSVFSFAITKAPKSVKALCEHFNINIEEMDCFTFHQANKFLNETIRKKLKLPEEKVPYSLQKFANSSCATIPVTLVTQRQKELTQRNMKHIACAFGVGLSWGSVYFETDKEIIIPDLIEI